MTVMREELAGKVEASKTDADAKLLALETQQQALAEQTASLFQSSEFQSVDSLLVNILAPVSQGPQESPSLSLSDPSLNSVRGDGKPASRTVRSMTTPTRSPAIVSTTGAGAACSDDKKTRVDGNGKGGVLRDPLAMTRGVAYHEEEEEEEMYPLSPLSPQYAYQVFRRTRTDICACRDVFGTNGCLPCLPAGLREWMGPSVRRASERRHSGIGSEICLSGCNAPAKCPSSLSLETCCVCVQTPWCRLTRCSV
jgi:hypothetical protein